jgi:hypothetical protein
MAEPEKKKLIPIGIDDFERLIDGITVLWTRVC